MKLSLGDGCNKSKDDAVKLIEKVIEDKVGQLKIMMKKVIMISKVLLVKLNLKDSAELLVRRYVEKHTDLCHIVLKIYVRYESNSKVTNHIQI